VNEFKLPVFFPKICASSLGLRDRQGRFVGIVVLANFTSPDNILEVIFEFYPFK
jgi:hypothetical protein